MQTRVSQCFTSITTGSYQSVVFDSTLKLQKLATPNFNDVPVEDVSFGTREQLALLTRLCLAELLAKEGEKQVVILDDNLVHTDDIRMALACRLLQDAASKVQIVIFTCHPERYKLIPDRREIAMPR